MVKVLTSCSKVNKSFSVPFVKILFGDMIKYGKYLPYFIMSPKRILTKGTEKLLLTLEQLVSTLTTCYIYFLSSPGSALSIGTNYVLETCVCQSVFTKKGTSMQFSKM